MITKNEFPQVLKALGFKKNKLKYTKTYRIGKIIVDLKNEIIKYPESEGLVVNEHQTCNFSDNENFVVLECVDRLLTKGYSPSNIELEPRWQVGHGASGGRADIKICDNNKKSLFIIECKTPGIEFNKHWKNTLQNGGQLFSYAVQDRNILHLIMYTSDYVDKKIVYENNIISLKDNEEYLLSLKKPKSFSKSYTKEELFETWEETYQLQYETKGVFEDDVKVYEIGKSKATASNLKEVSYNDIQKTYYTFATILRQHNVSSKENAFDKLVNLFLAKIVDELQNPNDLQFYWKGVAFDDYYNLQDRIQKLYKDGMQKFLGETVTYIDDTTIKNTFKLFKHDPDATRDATLNYFRQLKFYTNNDFAILDVHNEKLFYQNSEILLKIVKMLQDIKLKTENQNQFLGDLFEMFLDDGVKQSEGQFFTPLPIVRFMLSALPLKEIINNNKEPIKAIDYACGAGHFLNEYANQIKKYTNDKNISDYYKNTYGIEKEYRLSKVAKVSAFMYGQDEINIIYGDALKHIDEVKEGTFDVLIANPPYSVSGFLEVLDSQTRKKYELEQCIDPSSYQSNDDIELFFIERAKQLLKPNGVASIIFPSTILTNSGALNEKARDILLNNFIIVAIVQYPSGTFFKTKNTDTVALFLKKRDDSVNLVDHYKNRIELWFEGDFSKDFVFDDFDYISKYCEKIGIDTTSYKEFLKSKQIDKISSFDIFSEYEAAFDKSQQKKAILKKAIYKNSTLKEKKEILEQQLVNFILSFEKEKLLFFIFGCNEGKRLLFVKSPTTAAESKQYLGYEWKANEGLKCIGYDAKNKDVLIKNKGIDNIDTPLFNPNNFEDNSKINMIISKLFNGEEIKISDNLKEFVSYKELNDLIDYDTATCDRQINVLNTTVEFDTPYDLEPLNKLVNPIGGLWTSESDDTKPIKVIRNTNFSKNGKLLPDNIETINVSISELNKRTLAKGDIIIEKSGGSKNQAVGRVVYFDLDGEYSFSNFTARLRVCSNKVMPKYIHIIMNYIYLEGYCFSFQGGASGLKNLKLPKYLNIKIPVPSDKNVQKNIINEVVKLDEKFEKQRLSVEQYSNELKSILKKYKIIGGA